MILERAATLRLAIAFTVLALPARSAAQSLRPDLLAHAIDAAVLVSVVTPSGTSEGSGAIIDARGYVLTNFHVVGHVHPFEGGVPGELFRADGVVTLAHATSARTEARPTWTGRVVRGDPETDLALIRIEATADGTAIAGSVRFPAITIADRPIELSDRVFALGFPLGVRAVTLTSGRITGFDVDAEGALTYLRVDAEFNPGNSGGMLLDASARLVGVPTLVTRSRHQIVPIRKARPVERIPPEWRSALAAGPITDVRIDAIREVGAEPVRLRSSGSGFVFEGQELFFFRVPDSALGTIRFEVDRALEAPLGADAILVALDRPRTTLRVADSNALTIHQGDHHPLVVAVSIRRRRDDGTQAGVCAIALRLESTAPLVAAVSGTLVPAPVMTPVEAPALEAPPEAHTPPETIGWASFRLEGGLVIDPLVGQDYAGGGQQALELTAPIYVADSIWPVTIAIDYGVRAAFGAWRDSFFFMGSALAGARIGFGSPSFMIEVPLYYTLGIGTVEDELSFSPYGYETGLRARFSDFAIGVSWSESFRGSHSVLRALSLTTGWYF